MAVIYFEAALFDGPNLYFNSLLTDEFEKCGHTVLLPQRVGFELTEFEKLLKDFPDPQLAASEIISYYDLGVLLPASNVTVARLDEPADSGVDTEVLVGKAMGKLNIGYRTSVLSPHGERGKYLGGMNPLIAYACDYVLRVSFGASSTDELNVGMQSLAEDVNAVIQIAKAGGKLSKPGFVDPRAQKLPFIETLLTGGSLLAEQPAVNGSVEEIIENYRRNQDFFEENRFREIVRSY